MIQLQQKGVKAHVMHCIVTIVRKQGNCTTLSSYTTASIQVERCIQHTVHVHVVNIIVHVVTLKATQLLSQAKFHIGKSNYVQRIIE